jgi:hypothetical protein
VPDWNLLSKSSVGKAFTKNTPKLPFRICHPLPEPSRPFDGAQWRMMLHGGRSTTNVTPPQPLPIGGRG